MALNNLLNLPPSKVALKPPLPPFKTSSSPSSQPRRPFPGVSLMRREPPQPQRLHSSASSSLDATPTPPSSREEAVAQAGSCLATALQKPLNNSDSVPLKKLKKQKQSRFRAEIPVVDDSPGSLARLAFDVFSSGAGVRRKDVLARLLLVWPSSEALAIALQEHKNWGDSTAHAQLDTIASDALSACDAAVFLAPARSQVDKVKAAAATLEPKPVVLFNPAWSFDEEEGEATFGAGARGFLGSFNVVYSFTGLEVKGLMSKKTGVLLRCVDGGRFSGESWVLMVEADAPAKEGSFRVVSRLKRRPTIGEVETMLYNLMAANSPVTKSARFLREMVSNVTGKKRAKQ